MNTKIPLLWVLGLILIGCSKSDRINSESTENYQKSIISITKGMRQDERSLFMDNIALLNSKYGGFRSTVDDPDLRFLAHINGKSVADIDNESVEVRKQDKIENIKSAISLSNQHVAQLEANIATRLEEIKNLEKSIVRAKIQEEARKAGAVRAKEILDKLVIAEAKYYKIPENTLNPWMRNLTKERVEFKIVNETEYEVEIENVTIESGNTKIVLSGGFGCKGLAESLLGVDGKIRPKSEKNVQCEIQPSQNISDSGTINISGGRVLGVGEYNVSKSPFDEMGGFILKANEKTLEESRAELGRMEMALSVHQTRMTNSCNELADFEESFFLCHP
jgi:hypothetical protein